MEIVVAIILAITGIVLAFRGYSLLRIALPLLVFAFGAVFTYTILATFNLIPESVAYVSILVGLTLAALTFFVWKLGSLILVFALSYLLTNIILQALGVNNPSTVILLTSVVLVSFVVGALFKNIWRLGIIIITAIIGGLLTSFAIIGLISDKISLDTPVSILTFKLGSLNESNLLIMLVVLGFMAVFGSLQQAKKIKD